MCNVTLARTRKLPHDKVTAIANSMGVAPVFAREHSPCKKHSEYWQVKQVPCLFN